MVVICAALTHNLLRAAGTLASPAHAIARGATLRRDLIAVPARITRPQRRRVLHLPAHWPRAKPWTALWHAVFATGHPPPPDTDHRRPGTPNLEKLDRPAAPTRPTSRP